MGYSTDFDGELKFTKELTASQINALKKMCGEDCRDHDEWEGAAGLTHMDLGLNEDYSGLHWNGSEKTYDLTEKVNVIIRNMRKRWPDFDLEGSLSAQGEDPDDRWKLVIGPDGYAVKQDIDVVVSGDQVLCPHCGKHFVLE